MKYALLITACLFAAVATAQLRSDPYQCVWVLGAPEAWPPCTGGYRTRLTHYISSAPGCEPVFLQPAPLQETEACGAAAPPPPPRHYRLRITLPPGITRSGKVETITIDAEQTP